MAEIDCSNLAVREVNQQIRQQIAKGVQEIVLLHPGAKHNLAVGLLAPVKIRLEGSAGYYCGGMIDGPSIDIVGSAGWGVAESMMNGEVVVHQNAGNGAAAAIRGGTVVIHGDAAARLGVSMKGGTVLVGGNCGYMAGFMAQKGRMIVCGNAGDAFGDSLYSTVCYVGGTVAGMGTDAVECDVTGEEAEEIDSLLDRYLRPEVRKSKPRGASFRKIVAGRKLWNFDHRDWKVWQEAL